MSASFAIYTTRSIPSSNSGGGSGGSSGGSSDSVCGDLLGGKQTGRKLGTGLRKKKAAESDSEGDGAILPAEEDSTDDVALSPLLSAGLMMMDKGNPAKPPVKDMDTEDHELLKKRVQAGAHM